MRTTSSLALFALLACVSGCARREFDRSLEERRVLAAILEDARSRDSSQTLSVARGTFVNPMHWLAGPDGALPVADSVAIRELVAYGVHQELARAFVSVAAQTDSLPLPLALSHHMVLDTLLPLREPARDSLMRQWLHDRPASRMLVDYAYPGARMITSFSHVGFSKNGRRALIYVEMFCGALCAHGDFVVLELVEDVWTVRTRHNRWVS